MYEILSKVFPDEYIDIMSEECKKYFCDAFISVLKAYPDKDEQEYRIRKDSSQKATLNQIRLYPKLKDIKKPYQLCALDKMKVVMILIEPYNNGEATGIPLQLGRLAQPEYRAKTRLTSLQQTVDCIEEYIGLNFQHPTFPFWTGIDWELLLKEGVLLIHFSLTSEEQANFAHYKVWFNFTLEFINCLYNFNKDIIFLTIGELLQTTLLTLPRGLKMINAPDAYYTPEARINFREAKPFEKVNAMLKSLGLSELQFRDETALSDIEK